MMGHGPTLAVSNPAAAPTLMRLPTDPLVPRQPQPHQAKQIQNSYSLSVFYTDPETFRPRNASQPQHASDLTALELLMRYLILISTVFVGTIHPVFAQHPQPRRDPVQVGTDINSDAKAEETKQLIQRARERQKAVDQHNSDLWERWIYAVCVGCSWTPKNVRIVHTNPSRVLIGIPAAEDDKRERAGISFGT